MFMADNPSRLRLAMKMAGLEEVPISFDFEGTKAVIS